MRRVELRGMTSYNGPLKMGGLKFLIIAVLALLPIFGLFLDYGLAQVEEETYSNSLVLNIYLNDAGRALVTGYAESIDGLTFLNASQYSYDQDTRQIYALTNSLTYKSGDDWEARLLSQGYYGEYHSTFYLPGTVRLSKINSSLGLEYLVSASNESFVVDIHGYDIMNPDVAISYQLPIGEAPPEGLMGQANLLTSLGVLMLMLSGAAVAILARGRRTQRPTPALASSGREDGELQNGTAARSSQADQAYIALTQDRQAESGTSDGLSSGSPVCSQPCSPSSQPESSQEGTLGHALDAAGEALLSNCEPKNASETYEVNPAYETDLEYVEAKEPPKDDDSQDEDLGRESALDKPTVEPWHGDRHCEAKTKPHPASSSVKSSIEITSEMAAVMETLTGRERAVLSALIDHQGRMTQADIRYETKIPKSSLTGILLSLERRRLVMKKEWGRTNIIELSEWFLSKKERS